MVAPHSPHARAPPSAPDAAFTSTSTLCREVKGLLLRLLLPAPAEVRRAARAKARSRWRAAASPPPQSELPP